MRWIALHAALSTQLANQPDPTTQLRQAQQGLAWLALRFTPRVTLLDEAVLIEVSASLRLFGGLAPLLRQLQALFLAASPVSEADAKPAATLIGAQANTALLALARLRAGHTGPATTMPLATLTAAQRHLALLERLGCRTWGDLMALPRAGLARRLGADLLQALDQALGQQPETHQWLLVPEVFDQRLELLAHVHDSQALLFAAQRLLTALQVWLIARQSGLLAFELIWHHDARRHVSPTGQLQVRTAEARVQLDHLRRLLAEQLAQVTLQAPVHTLQLRSLQVQPLQDAAAHSGSLLLDKHSQGDSLLTLVERLSARLGATQVQFGQTLSEHRPEAMQAWQATPAPARRRRTTESSSNLTADYADLLPTWLLAEPLPLRLQGQRPTYSGPLALLVGPQRLESSGWVDNGAGQVRASVLRDYFVAHSAHCGLLWIFRERLATPATNSHASLRPQYRWFLHGVFA